VRAPVQVYWVKRIDNSRLVRQRDPQAVRTNAALVAGAAVFLGVILLCAWEHFQYRLAGYRLEKTQARYEDVLEWNRTLHLEQAALLDPMRIDVLARQRLGLEQPVAGQLVVLGTGEARAAIPVWARASPDPARAPSRVSIAD